MRIKYFAAATLLLTSLCAPTLQAALSHDPSLHWRTLTTAHFDIHFHDGEETLAQDVAAIAENAHRKLTTPLNWQPARRTQLILTDRFDFANGSATPFPRNTMTIIVTPPQSHSSVNDYNNWLDTLISHEYTHILHLDKSQGAPKFLQNIFGRLPIIFPNVLQPPWFIEGLATYYETDQTQHIGRGQSTQFRMLMRMEVAAGIKPLRQINQPLESWPMNSARYLYGVYFYQFIADNYGEEKVRQLFEQYSDNLIPFMINSNSQRVLNGDLSQLWNEFEEYLNNDFGGEIAGIRQRGETVATQLTDYGYFTGRPRLASNGDIYFLRDDKQSEPRLMRLRKDNHGHFNKAEGIADMRGQYFDLHPESGIVVSEMDTTHSTNIFADLYHIDPRSGRKTQLTHGGRYRSAAWSPNGQQLIAVHNSGGQSALHRLDANGKLLEILWQGKNGTVLGPLDWSPDGRQLAMPVWRADSLWNIESFSLANRQWKKLTRHSGIETSPHFSNDGQSLLFSADYGGVYNIQRLDLHNGKLHTLSNLIGGAFGPVEAGNGNGLYFSGINPNGYDLYFLPAPQALAVSPDNGVTSPAKPIAAIHAEKISADYSPLAHIAPTWWLPYFAVNNERSEVGFSTTGSDPLQRHNYNLLLAYDSKNDWLVGGATYLYDRWNPSLKFNAQRQILSLLDTQGMAVHFRNSDTFTAEALWPFFRYQRRWILHAGLVSEIESDKYIAAGFAPLPEIRDQLLGLAISYDSSRRYARAISSSNGRQLRIVAETNDLLDSDSSGQIYTLDWREFIDLPGEHVLTARLASGWANENPRPFRLGGSLPNSLPSDPKAAALSPTDAIFNHRRYALRGYPEGLRELTDRRMGLIDVEWRFPLALVERGFMAPPVGLHRLHGKLFFNAGDAWRDNFSTRNLKRGVGAEFTSSLLLGYWLPINLRLGYAQGLDAGGQKQVYLDLGASF